MRGYDVKVTPLLCGSIVVWHQKQTVRKAHRNPHTIHTPLHMPPKNRVRLTPFSTPSSTAHVFLSWVLFGDAKKYICIYCICTLKCHAWSSANGWMWVGAFFVVCFFSFANHCGLNCWTFDFPHSRALQFIAIHWWAINFDMLYAEFHRRVNRLVTSKCYEITVIFEFMLLCVWNKQLVCSSKSYFKKYKVFISH